MNKEKLKFVAIGIMALLIVLLIILIDFTNRLTAVKLAEIGENQFLTNQLEEYLTNIETDRIDDISCDVQFTYTYKYDYDARNKTLYMECTLHNFSSDKIDDYYTEMYNKEPSRSLAHILEEIDNRIENINYRYNVTDLGTVVVCVVRNTDGLTLTTSSGREYCYEYTPETKSVVTVEIDGRYVYLKTNFPDDSDSLTYYSGISECSLGHCDRSPREGSKYCHTHGCCIVGCQIEKDPFEHCCYKHNCLHPNCGAHRYDYANSKYCQAHYDEH